MEQQNDSSVNTKEDAAVVTAVLPGLMLREARERLGLSVADAADQTKLAPRQIEALEADDYASLPEMAFVRGFVRSYAKIVQLDSQPLLAMLPQAIVSGAAQVTRSSVEVPFPDAYSPRAQNLIWLGAALVLAVMVVVFAVWHYTSPRSQAKPEQTHPVEIAIALPAEAMVVATSDVPETVVEPVVEPSVQTPPAKPVTPGVVQPAASLVQPKPVAQPVAIPAIKSVQPAAGTTVKTTQPVVEVPSKPVAPVVVTIVKPVASVSAVKVAPSIAAASDVSKPAVVSAPTVVRLAFDEESWAEVRDANDNIVSSQINPAGSELTLKGLGPLSVVVGHASTSRLFHKGKKVDLAPHTSANSDVARLTLE